MRAIEGEVVTLDDGLNYIVAATLEENGAKFFNLISEDLKVNRYCVEAEGPNGEKGWKHITDENEKLELAKKFEVVFQKNKELQEYLKKAEEASAK